MTQIKTINIVRKLLALAEDGSGASEAEAALALEKARELMANANLTMATLEAAGQSGGEGSARAEDQFFDSSPYPWKRKLMLGVAALNSVYCGELWRRKNSARFFVGYQVVGREANVAATRVMYDYLVTAVNRVQRDFVGGDLAQTKDRKAHAFKEGCSARLVERLRERHYEEIRAQKERARAQPSTGNALVVVMADYYQDEQDLNNDMLRGWDPGTTARNRREIQAKYEAQDAKRREDVRKLVADGIPEAVAKYMVMGYSRERAEALAKPESPAQRKKRQSSNERYWRREWKKDEKTRTSEYQAGYAAGSTIGLDDQVDHKNKKKLV